MFAVVLALAAPWTAFWSALGWFSLAAHWTALPAAAVLCLCRARVAQLSWSVGTAVVLATVMSLAAAVSVAGELLLGQVPAAIDLARHVLLAGLVGALVLRYLYLAQQARQRALGAARARLQALQARMQPHFLFNSLNTIASLAGSDPPLAERATEALAALLRASLAAGDEPVPLADEIALTRHYLAVEQLRFGDRLKVEWQLDDNALEARIPPLTLQPLVENALRHGIAPQPGGGTVRIAAGRGDGGVWVEVENPVPGTAPTAGGNRMALDNLRERLHVRYGSRARLLLLQAGDRHLARCEVPAEPGA